MLQQSASLQIQSGISLFDSYLQGADRPAFIFAMLHLRLAISLLRNAHQLVYHHMQQLETNNLQAHQETCIHEVDEFFQRTPCDDAIGFMYKDCNLIYRS